MIARLAGILAFVVFALTGCGSDSDSQNAASATQEPSVGPSEGVEQTAPAGEQETHSLLVTIRDESGDFYDSSSSRCNGTDIGYLHIQEAGEDGQFFVEVNLPTTGDKVVDGACVVTMKLFVPYAKKYAVYAGVEGQGIEDPNDPTPNPDPVTVVTKSGRIQEVTFVR